MRLMSNPGLAGAAIGLALGLVEYFIAMIVVRAMVERETSAARKTGEVLPGMLSVPANMAKLRIALLLLAFTVYPAVGYAVGNLVAS